MDEFTQGRPVKSVHCYGPADTEYSDRYFDMEIVMVNGQMAGLPWVRAVHKESKTVTMINCGECACIVLGEIDRDTPF